LQPANRALFQNRDIFAMKLTVLLVATVLSAHGMGGRLHADELPDTGFANSKYEKLWSKSPFAVASPEAGPSTSPDYSLVGIAKVDGISYASLIDKKNQEHFLLGTDKGDRGLSLVSITEGKDTDNSFAVISRDGVTTQLKLEEAPAGPALAGAASAAPQTMPQLMSPGAPTGRPVPPPAAFRRRLIHIPPRPGQMPGTFSSPIRMGTETPPGANPDAPGRAPSSPPQSNPH
jgi:hypothetical protein